MIVYLEGADGSGKTTLAKKIEKYVKTKGWKYVMAEPFINTNPYVPGRVNSLTLTASLEAMSMNNNVVFILDRGPISDCIYRLFDDEKPVMNYSILRMYLEVMDNICLVYCHNSHQKQHALDRGDDNKIAMDNADKIARVYDMCLGNRYNFLKENTMSLRYNFEDSSVAKLCFKSITEFIDRTYQKQEADDV